MAANEVEPSELFSSPINPADLPKTPKTPKTPTPGGNSNSNNNNSNTNQKEKQPFDAEEVREAALRRELEGVRNINEVIEGVIGTLERAKGNMGVRLICTPLLIQLPCPPLTDNPKNVERLPDRHQRIHPSEYLDAHPLPDRTQPAPDSQQGLEWRQQGPRGDRGREPRA